MRNFIAAISGILFGIGLGLSQMIDRVRVLDFLDISALWSADRAWDPTLAFVMGGAVLVTFITFPLILRRSHPMLDTKFYVPTRRDIDRPLIIGSALFGIGWGIGGYCPGPGFGALVLGIWNPVFFVAAYIAGSMTYRIWSSRSANKTEQGVAKPPTSVGAPS